MPDFELHLSAPAARVLGSLLEKESTTPEYYPLSLLALTNACNQRSSRHPVMDLSEGDVRKVMGLNGARLVGMSDQDVAELIRAVPRVSVEDALLASAS